MPEAYKVAEYWASREGYERIRHIDPSACFVVDLGEPDCFACGWWPGWLEGPDIEGSLKHIWSKSASGLERCHLVPRDKEGSNDPENIVLLCKPCHLAAPDCINPDVMLRWVVGHEQHQVTKQRQVLAAVTNAGLDPERLAEWEHLVPEALERMREENIKAPRGMAGVMATALGLVAQRLAGAS